jgi:hypothetical protein
MNRFFLATSVIMLGLFLSSCSSNEIGNSKDVNPDAVFFNYEVWAEEGKSNVTVHLQYRMGGPNGTTLVLNEPSRVILDGEKLEPDSAKFSGAYYETQKPVASFGGKHLIVFTDLNKKEYKEEFEFTPFILKPDLPVVLTRGDLVFNLGGLDSIDYIRVLLTDTSFTSHDINDVDTVKNGRLIISAERLSALKSGPINLQFYKELEKPIKNGTREGGKLSITYGLKREFELKDPANP